MLFWLDFHQTQSNLYKWFRMQRHDWSSTSPKEPMLHLSSSPCTGYQWQLASSSRHWCLHTERPQAQHPPTSTHYYESTSPPEVWDLLVSDALWYHHREAQNHSPEHSHSPFLDGGIIFPPLSGMLDPCQSSSNNWKLISFGTTWLHPKLKKKKKKKLSCHTVLGHQGMFVEFVLINEDEVWLWKLPFRCDCEAAFYILLTMINDLNREGWSWLSVKEQLPLDARRHVLVSLRCSTLLCPQSDCNPGLEEHVTALGLLFCWLQFYYWLCATVFHQILDSNTVYSLLYT